MLNAIKIGAVAVVMMVIGAWPASAAVDRGESTTSDRAGRTVQADPHDDDERDGGLVDDLDELLDDLL